MVNVKHLKRKIEHRQELRRARVSSVLKSLRLKGPLLAVPDVHAPFHSRAWMRWIVQTARDVQPAYIVQVGDSRDYLCFSKWSKTLNLMTPLEEISTGRRVLEDMWSDLLVAAPKAERYQLLGNHDVRPNKRVLDALPAVDSLIDWGGQHAYPGVKTLLDPSEELMLGRVFLHHGHKQFGAHARWNQAPTIVGHSHTGGVLMMQNRDGFYWELNAGYGGDPNSEVFAYRYQRQIHGWTQGAGLVDERGPRFLPFVSDT